MKSNVKILKVIAVIAAATVVICASVYALGVKYWSERHKMLFSVDSVTAYDCPDNDDYYRFEINGNAKKWWFDNEEYNDVYLDWSFEGGELNYDVPNGKSNVFTVDKGSSDFTIVIDINKSDMAEYYIMNTRFDLKRAKDDSSVFDDQWAMFMEDYSVDVEWKNK